MYEAEIRCMYCGALMGYKEGFSHPGQVSHGVGECCKDEAHSAAEVGL